MGKSSTQRFKVLHTPDPEAGWGSGVRRLELAKQASRLLKEADVRTSASFISFGTNHVFKKFGTDLGLMAD